ncbi:MAG: hypothetical protein J1E85_10555 [Ruminococcus sp.]|nr:hypothetical protein [Ruminococcus sp.]
MFLDFNKLMKQEEETKTEIPDALVEYLNQKLPEGVSYYKTENGDYRLASTSNGNFTMGGLVFKPNEHQKKILGDKCSFDDVLEYINNSQKPMRVGSYDGQNILINGEKIPLKDFFLSPYFDINEDTFIQFIYPQKFPKPHAITLSCDDINVQIYIQRVANDSIHEKVFESVENEFLFFRLKLNDDSHFFSITIRLNIEQIDRVDKLIKGMKICNAFTSGKLKIDGNLIEWDEDNLQENKFERETIKFWEKLLKIEELLNLKFIPNGKEVTYQIASDVEKLYQCLINKVPFKEEKNFNTISGNWNAETEVKENIGKPILLTFDVETFNLYEQEFDLFYRIYAFNCVFDRFEKEDNGKSTISLKDLDDEKTRYMSTLLFKSKEELDNYDFKNNVEKFQNAKTYSEFTQED